MIKEELIMALWDNISKKASAVTEKAVQQAKNLSEQAKLHAQIAEAEKAITDSYTQIGKQYAAAHPDDYEAGFGELIAAIAASEQKIRDLRWQLQELKGVCVCGRCGAEVPKDAAFCSACGAPMPKPEPVDGEIVTAEAPAEAPAEEPVCPECAEAPVAETPAEAE